MVDESELSHTGAQVLRKALRLISATVLLLIACLTASGQTEPAVQPAAYEENPSSGSGPLAILFSGGDGSSPYVEEARAYAKEGYVVVLFDTTRFYTYREPSAQTQTTVRELIQQSLKRPGVTSTKASVIGYSRGGTIALMFANQMPDLVTSVVAYYPNTQLVRDPGTFLSNRRIKVPTLMLTGTFDSYQNCCPIEKARALAAAAALPEIGAPLQVQEYQGAEHIFNLPTARRNYRRDYAEDAFKRSLAHLRRFSANP